MKGLDKEAMTRISHSSANQLLTCERQFVFSRGLKLKPDVEQDTTALRYGSYVHKVLEDMEHFDSWKGTEKEKKVLNDLISKAAEEFSIETHWKHCGALAIAKYIKFVKNSGLKTALVECQIGDGVHRKGYVDLVQYDRKGYWHIIDIKTSAKSFLKEQEKLGNLHLNQQLGMYANPKHVKQICELAKEKGIDLVPEKLKSVRLRVTTKPTSRTMDVSHSYDKFCEKNDKYIDWYDFTLPASDINWELAEETMDSCQARALELAEGARPVANLQSCFNFFKPCEFYSQCYGKPYEEMVASSSVKVEMGELSDQCIEDAIYDLEDF